ncbi:MAG: DUF2635 domain-containing protein [Desulfovibrio sp.]|jgi:hypothetical protein
MLVKAAPGLRVPKEDKPRQYITEDAPVNVPESVYYLRRLDEGDLVLAQAETAPAVPKNAKKE